MSEKIYLYPVWIRVWHMVNAVLCILLILTGIAMQYSGYEKIIFRFDQAVSIHNVAGIILSINYLFFLIGNFVTDNGAQYKPRPKNYFSRLFTQIRFYTFGIFKKEPVPFPITKQNKFNPLQRLTYIVATYISLSLIVLTGWAYFFPHLIPHTLFGVSGILINAMLHIIVGFIISVFMIIHIYFCTIGATVGCNFVSMLTGWHQSH